MLDSEDEIGYYFTMGEMIVTNVDMKMKLMRNVIKCFKKRKFYWVVDITKLPVGMKLEDVAGSKKLLRKYGKKVNGVWYDI